MLESLIDNMDKFKLIRSIPAYIPLMNIDTDKIIPKQFLKTIKRSGLGKSLFYEMRFDEKGNPIKGFILDQEPFKNSKILITGKNFGCGSSREHAPWALLDFGIKVIISESFADIFYNNCFKNGILPIVVKDETINELKDYSSRKENIEVKLEEQEIIYGNKSFKFELDSFKKKCLLEGLDDIALSLKKVKNITNFESQMSQNKPWL
jgi:3-isopropylmalate/(R)-2-methylmalate dehydratase small subunit|tara:strand:+ start:179 stop:799 length:621 start_codon:yes stop_codon:yes gene_type:complete